MPWKLCFVCSHVLVILSVVCQGWVVVDVHCGGVSGGEEMRFGKVAVEVCVQVAVVVRACVQQYATHCQCGALCVLIGTHTVDCCATQYTQHSHLRACDYTLLRDAPCAA